MVSGYEVIVRPEDSGHSSLHVGQLNKMVVCLENRGTRLILRDMSLFLIRESGPIHPRRYVSMVNPLVREIGFQQPLMVLETSQQTPTSHGYWTAFDNTVASLFLGVRGDWILLRLQCDFHLLTSGKPAWSSALGSTSWWTSRCRHTIRQLPLGVCYLPASGMICMGQHAEFDWRDRIDLKTKQVLTFNVSFEGSVVAKRALADEGTLRVSLYIICMCL